MQPSARRSTSSTTARPLWAARYVASTNGADESTAASTRSGYAAAISSAITAPVWWPTIAARSSSSASTRPTATSAHASIESSEASSRDSAKPRVSIAIAGSPSPRQDRQDARPVPGARS